MTTTEPTTPPAGQDTTPARLITRHLADPEPAPVDSGDPIARQHWDERIWHHGGTHHGIWVGV